MLRTAALACLLPAACWLSLAPAKLQAQDKLPQGAQSNVLTVTPPASLQAKAGSTVEVKLKLQLAPGYHVNSNTPSDKYLIPLKLTWNPGPLEAAEVIFPKPRTQKTSFSPEPLSVFSGEFELLTRFKVAPTAAPGPATLLGKVHYQACNDRMCLTPKNLDVAMQVDVVK